MDKSTISVALFNKLASAYQEKFMDVSAYSAPFDDFCARIQQKEPRVLDIACGPGNISRYLLDQRPDLQLLGIDLAPKMIDLAKENNPEAEFLEMDARRIADLEGGFAGVMCGFCLPYLNKEEALQLIADAAQILLPGGAFFISTMEGNYEDSKFHASNSYPDEKMFIHYHQEDYLTAAMEENGFEQMTVSKQLYYDGEKLTFNDLILVAEMGK